MSRLSHFLLSVILLILAALPVRAQWSEPVYSAPSPDVATLGTFGQVPVSLFTGTPDISVPIYEVTAGDFSFPIALSYHLASVKPNIPPGNYGLVLYDFGARFYSPYIPRWITMDPLAEKYYDVSPYAYCAGDPMSIVDRNGNILETAWDIASLGLGVASLISNIKARNVGSAIMDGLGIVADAAAVALPLVPGGVSAGIKAARGAAKGIDLATDAVKGIDNGIDAAKTLNKVDDVEKTLNRATDATKNRVKLRKDVKQQIIDNAPKTPNGDFIDPNTGKIIPKEGPYDIGHVKGQSWQKRKTEHQQKGHTRKEVIEAENDPSLYQIEDPSSNRSRKYD